MSITVSLENMKAVANCMKVVAKNESRLEVVVTEFRGKNGVSPDKAAVKMHCISDKKCMEAVMLVDKPSDLEEGKPYMKFAVDAQTFFTNLESLLVLQSDVQLVCVETVLKLVVENQAQLNVPLLNETLASGEMEKELMYQSKSTIFMGQVNSDALKAMLKRNGMALSSNRSFLMNITCSFANNMLDFFTSDGIIMEHVAAMDIQNCKIANAPKKEGEDEETNPEVLFAIPGICCSDIDAVATGSESVLVCVNPKQICIGGRPTANVTTKYTAMLAQDLFPKQILDLFASYEKASDCECRVVVDSTGIKNAIRILTSTADATEILHMKIVQDNIILSHKTGTMKIALVDQEGSTDFTFDVSLKRFSSVLSLEGSGNVLLSFVGDQKAPMTIQSGDLENTSNSISALLPCKPDKVEVKEKKEKKEKKKKEEE